MHRIYVAFGLCGLLFACPRLDGQQDKKDAGNRPAGRSGGDPARGKTVSGTDKASGAETRRTAHVRLLHNSAPAAARVSIGREVPGPFHQVLIGRLVNFGQGVQHVGGRLYYFVVLQLAQVTSTDLCFIG